MVESRWLSCRLALAGIAVMGAVVSAAPAYPEVAQADPAPVNAQPAWDPDVFGGYASTHVVIRLRPGFLPGRTPDGRWTLQNIRAPQQLSAAIAETTQRYNVSSIKNALNSPAANQALAAHHGLDRYFIVKVPASSDTPALAAELGAFPNMIESAQVDGVGGIASIPDDGDFIMQWNMHNMGQIGGVVDADIDAPECWDLTQGSSSIILAMLDTGVQYRQIQLPPLPSFSDHPDLAGRILPGWSTYSNTADAQDQHGHGTHTAGIAAASGNNGVGVAGVNWNLKILPVQCVNPTTGSGNETQCAEAVIWATDHGAHIISMSLQYYSGNTILRDAVAYAYDSGVLPIAATGNFHTPGTIAYPAKWPKCMAVGATNRFDLRYSGSNTGPEIDVSAPGQDIYSTWKDSTYFLMSGTSMATPHVSGLATLIKTRQPSLMPAQIEQIMKATAEDKGAPGFDEMFGFGRINARAAIEATGLAGDVNGDFVVNIDDLLGVILAWGPCPVVGPCTADVTQNGVVNIDDLLMVIANWS